MNDATLFPIIATLLALYALVVVAEWLSKLYWWLDARKAPEVMECPACGEIAYEWKGMITLRDGKTLDEYECEECKAYGTF